MGAVTGIGRKLGGIWRKCLDIVKRIHLATGIEDSPHIPSEHLHKVGLCEVGMWTRVS